MPYCSVGKARYETEVIVGLTRDEFSYMRIVTLDIERVPGRFRISGHHGGLDIEGDFWDLSQWKRTIGRRINPDEVLSYPRTICLAWRQLGQKRVEFAAEWQDGGHDEMLAAAWRVYNDADAIVGHNAAAFDTKHLNTGWRDLGLPPPAPFKVIDTLSAARKVFGDESKTLNSLCKRLEIPAKTDKYDPEVAKAAVAGDTRAQRKLAAYNKGDIIASEALYLRLRPWIPGHPHQGLYMDTDVSVCSRCGSEDLQRRGYAVTNLGKYRRFQCMACGAWSRGKRAVELMDARGI